MSGDLTKKSLSTLMEQDDGPRFYFIPKMLITWKNESKLGTPFHPRSKYKSAPALCKWDDARAVIEMSLGLHPFCRYTSRRGFETTSKDRFMWSYIEGYFLEEVVKTKDDLTMLKPIPSSTFIKNGMRVVYTIHPLPRVGEKREKYSPYLPKRYKDAVQTKIMEGKKRIRISPQHYSDSPFSSFKRAKKS